MRSFPGSLSVVALWFIPAGALHAQIITTYAGGDNIFPAGVGQATAVQIGQPDGLAVDAHGNVYVSSLALTMVLKVTPSGVITVVAGNGLPGGGNGIAVGASLYSPGGLAFDQAGNLYIADGAVNVVHKVDTSGNITIVAGNGQVGHSGDGGPATKAQLILPVAVAVDKADNLYIVEGGGYIRKVTPEGTISTVAGNGAAAYKGDGGPATKASLSQPDGLAVDAAGDIYVADQYACAIRKFQPGGNITTVAGGKCGFSGEGGLATKAAVGFVGGVTVGSSGELYFSDIVNQCIWSVSKSGTINAVAGNGQTGFLGDGGPALQATLNYPTALAVDPTGAVVFLDVDNNRVRRFVPGGSITTMAGETLSVGDLGPSTSAVLTTPGDIAVDGAGNLYIPDSKQNRVRKVAPSGIITTVAGTGTEGNTGDGGPATAATLSPNAVAVDHAGNLFIAAATIRRVDVATGKIATVAGNGTCCYRGAGTGGDGGPAQNASLGFATSIAVDASGNIYFNDLVTLASGAPGGATIRRVTTDGTISTYAGAGLGFGGDGGPAAKALFGANLQIAIGPDGSLYIGDRDNNCVRRVDPATGIIDTVAGNGTPGPSGDGGQATSAGLQPWSITLDRASNLYIGSPGFVRKVTPEGVISTYAGNGVNTFAGDGESSKDASFDGAGTLATDPHGDLFFTDGKRIRIVEAVAPVLTVSPTSLNFTSTGAISQPITVSNGAKAGTMNWAATVTTTSGGSWLSVSSASGSSQGGKPGAGLNVTVQSSGLASGDYYGEIRITSPSAVNYIEIVTVRLTVGTLGPEPPQVVSVVSTATFAANAALAPGTSITIFGSNLTDPGKTYTSSSLPLPRELGGTSVTIGGELLPLMAVTPGQINAVLPLDLPVNTALPLVVTHNNAISAPAPVSLTAVAPGIFTVAQNGSGTGVVTIVHPDGTEVKAGNGNAATAGDTLIIYGTGLGAVNPREVAGAPAISEPMSQTLDPVTVTIGGVNAPVSFAGPTPGSTGLYQVNVTVPSGIATSSAAPLVLTQGGKSSPSTVTIPIQ